MSRCSWPRRGQVSSTERGREAADRHTGAGRAGNGRPLVPRPREALVRRLCQGTDVQFRRYPNVGHGAVIAAAMPDMLAWAADRREGDPASSKLLMTASGS